MNKDDMTVHEIDMKNGIIALFDRRERKLYSVSVAEIKVFDMSKLPGRPRSKPSDLIEPTDDLEAQTAMFDTPVSPLAARADEFEPSPSRFRQPLGGGVA